MKKALIFFVFLLFSSGLESACLRDSGIYTLEAQKQQMAYVEAVALYKQTWAEADIVAASQLALTTPTAAWPFVNAAYHLIQTKGDLHKAAIYIREAEKIVGTFPGQPADVIRAKIKSDKDYFEMRGVAWPQEK